MTENENPEKNEDNLDEEKRDINIGDNVALKSEKTKASKEVLSFDTTPIEISKSNQIGSIIDTFLSKFLDKILIAIAVVVIIYVIYIIFSK